MGTKWNNSNIIQDLEKEIGPESTLYWLLISICGAIVWTVYLTYYNSRVLGLILTAVINRFVPHGHVKFGSFSVSVLSGKVMFRDVHFITEDYSVRAQLGFAIFRWWRPLTDKDITEDLSHSETRLSIYLDSFELHVYNRSANYQRLEKLFGLDKIVSQDVEESSTEKSQTVKLKTNWQWRDLIPVIKIEVSSGRLVFGNYLIPQTLSINFGDAHIVYTTKPASTPFDQFMHIIKCKADNIRIMAIPSPKYLGKVDEPPRCMGDGFVVLQSNDVDIYYYQDEPGLVPYEPEMVQLANGDVIAVRTWPCWGMDVKCGKNTDISYGPWADRQREFLWHFFYPPDYQPTLSTVLPDPGQLRVHRSFDFKMSMQNAVTIDILFTKNKETQAVHMNCKQGSYLEFTIPYVIDDSGYVTKINGQLMHVDMSTSLKFRSLVECETLEFLIEIRYPQNWNDHQEWNVELTACKAAGYLILHHKAFFIDLIEDWSSKFRPDILHFVPYTWHVSILLKEFELMTVTNEWNWIDCFGATPENAHLGICGDTFDLTFDLPFVDYLPKTVPIKFFIRGESAEARMYLPETNTSRHIVIALSENMKIMGRDGTVIEPTAATTSGGQTEKKWRKICLKSDGWVDVWTTPIAALSIGYVYHPIPPTGNEAGGAADESLDAEETLLIPVRLVPLRPLRPKKNRMIGIDYNGSGLDEEFDPTKMEDDQISVEIEIGPSVCYAYGSLVRNFLHLKENYFGEDIKFTDFEQKIFSGTKRNSVFEHVITPDVKDKPFDPRRYRPLHIRVLLMLHDVQAHLVKNCVEDGPPCPCVFLERLVFEMDKRYEETKLQVFLSPALLVSKDLTQRPPAHAHLQDGHLTLSGLQIRGHAMFSHEGLPLDSETLEYAWLFELTIGDLTGRLTAPQLQNIVEFLQTLLYLVQDPENVLLRPVQDHLCQHMVLQSDCKQQPDSLVPCPTSDDIKYRFTRLSVDCVDIYLVESGSALNVQVFPVRVSTCNVHSHSTKLGVTVLIPEVNIKQFVLSIPVTQVYDSDAHIWLEAGGVSLGPVVVDAALASPNQDFLVSQQRFLRLHDKRTQRLTFLWPSEASLATPQVCGCLGGCQFFGSNRNGPTFFNPSHQDFVSSTNAAVLNICPDGSYYGYGQSLLQPNQLVFDQQTLSAPHSRKTGGVPPRRMRTEDDRDRTLSHRKDTDEVEESPVPSRVSTLVDWDRSDSTIVDAKDHSWDKTGSGSKLFRLSSVEEKDVETGSITSGVPSEYLPGVAMPDAYDTDRYGSTPSDVGKTFASVKRGSVSSLAEVAPKSLLPLLLGHERKRSYEPPKTFQSEKASPEAIDRSQRQGSRGSLISAGAGAGVLDIHGLSRHSSLTSPVLRRLSSQLSMQNDSSITSIVTSDKFFSAAEDASSSAASLPKNMEKARRAIEIPSTFPGQSIVGSVPGLHSSVRSPDSDAHSSSLASFNAAEFHPAESSTDADSFVSACSSHHQAGECECPFDVPLSSEDDVTCTAEDDESLETDDTQIPFAVNYIDLHGQINQPITKSPLLMSCYLNHMTKLHCSSWSLPVRQPNGSNVSPNRDSIRTGTGAPPPMLQSNMMCIPEFSYVHEGFTTNLMVGKRLPRSPSTPSSNSSASGTTSKNNYDFPSASETLPPSLDGSPESKLTAVINLKGSVDIMISPLMLEALQRYLEAVTPVLASLSPSTIVDSLHLKCTSSVEEQSRRKRKRHASSSDSSEKKDEGPVGKKDKGHHRHHRHQPLPTAAKDALRMRPEAAVEIDKIERKSKGSRRQVIFFLSKINVCVLQASLVEETISISALERARELTCVSVLAASIDSIHLQLLTNSVLHSPPSEATPSGGGADLPGSSRGKCEPSSPKANSLERDAMLEGDLLPLEAYLEDVVGSLNVARIHFQLRRMKMHSNYSDSIFLTAIPEHRSKVLFTFQKQPAPLHEEAQQSIRSGGGPTRMEIFPQTNEPGSSVEDIAGFIMFECGMENISLKAARRDGYNAKMNEERFQNVAKILHDIEIESKGTQVKFETETSSLAMKLPASCVPDGCLTKEHEGRRDSDLISLQSLKSWADGNTADDEASWKSRVSHQSTSSVGRDENNAMQSAEKLRGDASSCVLEFKTVWFNFAAPPPSPRKRKLEYTRNDWNLLSTATPAINSWMNPCHRAMVAASRLHDLYNKRVCTIMACIMTDALETQGIHMPAKSKYNRITPESKTLQEDPSCQLLTVLRRYIHRVGVRTIEENQHEDTLPQLWTVKKGILVLTRQWKNILYMPMLANSNFKTKKKVAVTFAIPLDSGVSSLQNVGGGAVDDGEGTLDNFEVIDEKTSLLKAEGGSVQKTSGSIHRSGSVHRGSMPSAAQSPPPAVAVSPPPPATAAGVTGSGAQTVGPIMDTGTESIDSRAPRVGVASGRGGGEKSHSSRHRSGASVSSFPAHFSLGESPIKQTEVGSSQFFPATPGGGSAACPVAPPPSIPANMRQNTSHPTFSSESASNSSEHMHTASAPSTPVRQSLTRHLTGLDKREDEDMYRWMQRQQEFTRTSHHATGMQYYPSVGQESWTNTGISDLSQDDSLNTQRVAAMARPAFQLADAQVLFKPLLRAMSLQLETVHMSAMMKKFGGDVSITGILNALRVEIVDSEANPSRRATVSSRGKLKQLPKFLSDKHFETPAFLCDTFAVMLSMKDVINFEADKEKDPEKDKDKERDSGTLTVGPSDLRQKSLNALRLALDQMEAKPTTTKVNFSVNCQSITQHVNMSLLRLVHQFVTMIENIFKTQLELKDDPMKSCLRQAIYSTNPSTTSQSDAYSTKMSNSAVYHSTDTSGSKADRNNPLDASHLRAAEASGVRATGSRTEKTHHPSRRPDHLPSLVSTQPGRSPEKPLKGHHPSVKTGADLQGSGVQSPLHSINLSDSIAIEMADTSSPAVAEKTIVDEIKENTPKCWRTLYHLLDLYSMMPAMKTIAQSRLSDIAEEEPDKVSESQSTPFTKESATSRANAEVTERQPLLSARKQPQPKAQKSASVFTQSFMINEKIPLVVFGVAKVQRIHISAHLSGLKLEAELQGCQASATHREKVKGVVKKKSTESSVTLSIGHTMIVLLEGVQTSMQTVVTVNITKSQGLYSSFLRRSTKHNSGLLNFGLVNVDIPQHPVALHTMVVHSSKRLSTTLQEFIKIPSKIKAYDIVDMGVPPTQQFSQPRVGQHPLTAASSATDSVQQQQQQHQQPLQPAQNKAKPIIIHFKAQVQGLTIGASLLPSLKAQYKIGEVTSSGVTGAKARCTIDLPTHALSFSSRLNMPSSLPSSASIDLPPIHVHAEYRQHDSTAEPDPEQNGLSEGLTLLEGSYLKAVADVGAFEHILTTDLLNHLVFVQKVFMKEVNEVVQKVSGVDQPVPLWSEDMSSHPERRLSKPLLYSFLFRLKGIQITATTPTMNAVRLETSVIELELSNRIQRANRSKAKDETEKLNTIPESVPSKPAVLKVFIKAQVDLNLALGTIIKNPMFEEAESEFQHLASFQTRITLRNALQDEMIPGVSKDQEALLIALKRPIIFVLPAAFDKAVLVWLNYKNAYEYWNEQRMALNKEVQTATEQVLVKLPLSNLTQTAVPALGTLFLQLTVDDLGMCLPLNPFTQNLTSTHKMTDEPGAALVLTLESTQISACSYGSLVSKGKFTGFCLRFADDFQVTWDDWKPDKSLEVIMNAFVVPHGTYEVCSRTVNAPRQNEPHSNAKWILNILWQMRGIDIHLDTNIGKRLSAIGSTLTTLAGDQFDDDVDGPGTEDQPPSVKVEPPSRKQSMVVEGLPDFVYDSSLDSKTRARLIEKEMNEQAKLVQDLHQLRASKNTIEEEERKLNELQAALFHDFRQDIMKKLKRQSVKASAIKDKLGLGSKSQHSRSHSAGVTAIRGMRRGKDGKPPMTRYTSYDTGQSIRHFPGHSRTVSIDTAELPSAAVGTPEVFASGSSHPSQRFNFPADAFGLPEEDSTPSSPNFSNDTPVSIERSLLRTQNLSDTTSDSDLGEQPFIAPRKAIAKTNISTATPPLCNTPEETPRQKVPPSPGATMAPSISSVSAKLPMEPNVDFELDVKVGIDSGKCVLHPKEPKPDGDPESRRSVSSKGHPPPVSPKLVERKKSGAKKLTTESAAMSSARTLQTHLPSNITVFFLPGVDVKVHYVCQPDSMDQPSDLVGDSQLHYSSKMGPHGTYESPTASSLDTSKLDAAHPQTTSEDVADAGQTGSTSLLTKKTCVKKANLYAWLSLQQLPEEMLISPALLDFLEQAIEPIPKIQLVSLKGHRNANNRTTIDLDTSATSLVSSSTSVYSSFPVDVVVYIRVQPSLVRFTCLPVSRVECLLRMPSLDVVFSTKKADVESNAISDPLLPSNTKGSASQGSAGSLPSRGSNASRSHLLSAATLETSVGGGLSVTACLNDFSLYIFHPYGGGQKKASLSVLENTFRKGVRSMAEASSTVDEKGTPHLEATRKDSLSLNVEFVKVNIARSRRGLVQSDFHLASAASLAKLAADVPPTQQKTATAANSVRFSAVCDIGSASFKYDMRRLLEILALPKAWYRRSLARRMFLGEELAVLDSDLESDMETAPVNLSSSSPTSESSLFTAFNKVPSTKSAGKWHVDKRREEDKPTGGKDKPQDGSADHSSPIPSINVQSPFQHPVFPGVSSAGAAMSAAKSVTNWETLVLFAVNLSELDVVVNMSNVMGNTTWSTKELKSQGRLSIDSSGYKNMKISAGLNGSRLDARGGIIGGNIELQGLDIEVCISEDPGREPEHVIKSQLHIMESRLDYMGSSILIGRISDLKVKVSDEWQVEACHRDDQLRPPLTNRSVIIFVHGDLSWDKFHLMISRSTTPDLIKMAHKLEEFFTQQRTSSKRVLSAFGPMSSGSKPKIKQKDEDSWISEIRHHRHWQKVLEHLSGCKMSMFFCTLPDRDTVIGGTMSLQGKNISLACFHGINFRSKSWALFTMDEPYICFATEAADIDDSGAKSTHIVQNLSFQLGHNMTEMTEKRQMAMICKLSRGHYMPPPFTSVQEWFHYSFATTEHKNLDSFPAMVRPGGDGASDPHRQTRRMSEYAHDTEIIFILPSLQMHLKTEHLQGEHEPLDDDPKPIVECSFVTEFEDHIFVAMDAEAVLFVHDLVINYVKEKDKGSARVPKSPEAEKQKLENPTSVLKQDFRDFDCKTWHLEPTVRLLSWAGKRIDPVGVDYILQKLGFQHARLTIPKWMQRGCMDPLDKILSVLVKKLVTALKEQEKEEKPVD